MATSWLLGPNPKWFFVQNNGKPLSGGLFYTYRSLDKSQKKSVYTDPSANFPWPNPITIDANGTTGPLFFEVDDAAPLETYFILVTDANGNEMWSVDDYLPTGGGGGGGTSGLDLENLITNNVFYRHVDTTVSVPTFLTVAPSNNTGLVNNGSTAADIPNPAPDIVFLKNNASATDTISFPLFTLGLQPITADTAPVDYFNYTCSAPGAGETTKCLQFPITAKVQNLTNKTVTGTFWARANGGLPQSIILEWFQYFGDGGGASAHLIQQINVPFSLTNSWVKYNFQDIVPDVSGQTLGGPPFGGALHNQNEGPNDSLFFRVVFPLNATTNIDFTKPTMYLGTVLSDIDFHSYDEIDSIISLPRTGDVRTSLNVFTPFGWVPCNDGVLSNGNNAIVLPTNIRSARNNEDTYPLYHLIWNVTAGNPTFAPIYDSAGAASVRGASAIADFEASKQLTLTRMLGRVLAGADPITNASLAFTADAATDRLTVTSVATLSIGTPIVVTGGALPGGIVIHAVYYVTNIVGVTFQLAQSLDFAKGGVIVIDLTSNGSGTLYTAIGAIAGQGLHSLTAAEMPPHTHTVTPIGNADGGGSVGRLQQNAQNNNQTSTTFSTGSAGGIAGVVIPHNTMQPTAFLNVFLKL